MAIQFQCPHCEAAIRVPDTAGGKKGRCPQCGRSLLVPFVPTQGEMPDNAAGDPPPAPPAGSVSGGAPPSPVPVESPPVPVAPVADAGNPFAFLPDAASPPPVSAPRTSVARRLRRRRFRASRILVPLVCGLVLVGLGVWMFWKSAPKMEGTLSAVRLDEFGPATRTVDAAMIDLPRDQVGEILGTMQTRPLPSLLSEVMTVEFAATDAGLTFTLRRGRETVFYRVNPSTLPAIRDFLKEHRTSLDAERRAQIKQAATAFVRDWQQAREAGVAIDATAYRDSLALPALAGGFGHSLQAVIGTRIYPAVFQDDEGQIYFLLPPGTRHFRLEGRPTDGTVRFPGQFPVTVAAAPSPPATPPASSEPEISPDPASDPAMPNAMKTPDSTDGAAMPQ